MTGAMMYAVHSLNHASDGSPDCFFPNWAFWLALSFSPSPVHPSQPRRRYGFFLNWFQGHLPILLLTPTLQWALQHLLTSGFFSSMFICVLLLYWERWWYLILLTCFITTRVVWTQGWSLSIPTQGNWKLWPENVLLDFFCTNFCLYWELIRKQVCIFWAYNGWW
jgi:hypothetical protein